jgi:hypothetical protein
MFKFDVKADVTVNVHVHTDDSDHIRKTLDILLGKVNQVTKATDDLKAALAAQGTVIGGAVTFIRGVPALVAEAVRKALQDEDTEDADTEAAVNEARTTAEGQTAELVAALTEGTGTPPADPTDPTTAPPVDPNA